MEQERDRIRVARPQEVHQQPDYSTKLHLLLQGEVLPSMESLTVSFLGVQTTCSQGFTSYRDLGLRPKQTLLLYLLPQTLVHCLFRGEQY